jgi:uncharacterized protein YceH (UPF0502 family)
MEKLGIAKSDLIAELKQEYQSIKEAEGSALQKEASAEVTKLRSKLASLRQRIDELEVGEQQ